GLVVTVNKVWSNTEKSSSSSGLGENHWNNNYARKNEHLLNSGELGMCDDPYCTTCPANFKDSHRRNSKASTAFDAKLQGALYGDAKCYARRLFSFCSSFSPGIINPHTKLVQQWNKFLAISCLFAIFLDPLFFFLIYVQKDCKCIAIDGKMASTLVIFRSVNDFVYFLNILLQFRLAYVSPESRVVGAGDLVDHPKKIALHYLRTYFLIDLFVALPLPQIMIVFVLPRNLGMSSGANYAKNILRAAVLVQYIPRLFRFLPLLIGQSPSGFIFESAWTNFIINLLIFMLSSHVVGSCWYLFGVQRVNQCLRDACHNSDIDECMKVIDCGHGRTLDDQSGKTSAGWINNVEAIACLNPSSKASNGFSYGIYANAVPLTTETDLVNKYLYALFWGFQQISSLGSSLIPSYFVKLEMQLRGRDVERWMSHRHLPEDLK
ncbi:hypothetical protein HN873_016848, partial [Arachis hypogaea]